MVVEAVLLGEGGDGFLGFGEVTAGGFDPDAEEVLAGGGAEDAPEAAVKLTLRKAGHAGEIAAGEGVPRMPVHLLDDFREACLLGGAAADLIEAAGKAGDADDDAFGVAEGELAGEDEAWGAFGLGRAFDTVEDGFASGHDVFVIAAVFVGALEGEEIVIGLAHGVLGFFDAAVVTAAAVHGDEAAVAVLDEEGHVGEEIEEVDEFGAADLAKEGLW